MSIPSTKLTVKIQRIFVNSNGELPQSKPAHSGDVRNNALTATLAYPRGGAPQVSTVIQADLQSGKEVLFDPSAGFFEAGNGSQPAGLFKGETVEGESVLEVNVTTRHTPGEFAQIFAQILGSAAQTALFSVPGGMILGSVVSVAVSAWTDRLTADKDHAQVIGQAKYPFKVSELTASPSPTAVELDLIAPKTITRTYFETQIPPEGGPGKQVEVTRTLISGGQSNGKLSLLLFHED
jgi:hypothetical protein